MPALRDMQMAFMRAVLDSDSGQAASLIVDDGLAPAQRLSIYGNNSRVVFLDTLERGFAVLVRLGGQDWFRQTAREYRRAYPSRAGDVRHIGANFDRFLAEKLHDTPYEYFADVARLCRAYQEVLDAPEHLPFDLDGLRQVQPQDYGQLRFLLHPAARLVASPWPILDIWRANQPEVSEPPTIDLGSGASHLLVIRRSDHVELRALPAADFAFLQGCAAGQYFDELAAQAATQHPEVAVAQLLHRLIEIGALAGFSRQPPVEENA